jgi:hypothetical protein
MTPSLPAAPHPPSTCPTPPFHLPHTDNLSRSPSLSLAPSLPPPSSLLCLPFSSVVVRERVFAQHPATPRAHLQYDPSRYPIQLGKYWLGPIDPTRPHDDPGGGYGVCTAVWAAFSPDRSTAPTQNWFGRGGRRCLTHQLRGGLAGSVKAGINSETGERVCCKLSHEEYEGTEAQVYDCSIHCLLTVPRHQSSSQF